MFEAQPAVAAVPAKRAEAWCFGLPVLARAAGAEALALAALQTAAKRWVGLADEKLADSIGPTAEAGSDRGFDFGLNFVAS